MSYYIIQTLPGTQKNLFYVSEPPPSPNRHRDIGWTKDRENAFKYSDINVANLDWMTASNWCKCEVIEVHISSGPDTNPEEDANDAYDRAMGIIK